MEKYARQAVSEGVKNADDLHVGADSELYRVLNLHYNRNNHIEVWGPQVREPLTETSNNNHTRITCLAAFVSIFFCDYSAQAFFLFGVTPQRVGHIDVCGWSRSF